MTFYGIFFIQLKEIQGSNMTIQNVYLASPEHCAKLVKVSPTGKELNFDLNFQLPVSASFNDVSARLDEFLRSDSVRKTLDTLKGRLIHIRVLHPVDWIMSVKFQSG
jgi:hypothetical protein